MKKLLCVMALVGMFAAPGVARAQLTAGPMAALDTEGSSTFGIGAFLGIPVPSLDPNLSIQPAFLWYFPSAGHYWELSGDAVYAFQVSADTPVLPFALAGINIAHASVSAGGFSASSTDTSLELGGGVGFRAASVNPFAGGKFELRSGSPFVLFGGVGFAVGS
jgi:Outer membrane protein beta-barrel domain